MISSQFFILQSALFISLVVVNTNIRSANGQLVTTGRCPKLPAMKHFDIKKYKGYWYPVEKYPMVTESMSSCVLVEYLDLGMNDTFGVNVWQNQFGQRFHNPGTNYLNSKDGSAGLTFDILITQSPIPFTTRYSYIILHTDYVSYTIKYGCVQMGPLSFQNVWILSRDKQLSPKAKKEVYSILKHFGLKPSILEKYDYSDCKT